MTRKASTLIVFSDNCFSGLRDDEITLFRVIFTLAHAHIFVAYFGAWSITRIFENSQYVLYYFLLPHYTLQHIFG